jgi:dihydroorotase-like cyclic amidohydrolase
MPSILIESAKLIVHDELATDSGLGHGVIKRNTALKSPIRAAETIHANRIALGALMDAHVHIRDMQLEHKKFQTRSQAASAGGDITGKAAYSIVNGNVVYQKVKVAGASVGRILRSDN